MTGTGLVKGEYRERNDQRCRQTLRGVCFTRVPGTERIFGYQRRDGKKVYEAIRKLDFVPSNTARMLSKKATRIVGLTIPDIKDPFFSENAAGAEKLLQENGYQIFYGNMERSAEKLLNFLIFPLPFRKMKI